jgi:tetratricopeptide (TPR) repeat protein
MARAAGLTPTVGPFIVSLMTKAIRFPRTGLWTAFGVLALAFVSLLLVVACPGGSLEKAQLLDAQADSLIVRGEFTRALELYNESFEIRARRVGPDSTALAEAYLNVGRAWEGLDSLEEAEADYRRCIELSSAPGGDTQMLARGHSARAAMNLRLELYHRAEPDLREALRLKRLAPAVQPLQRSQDWQELAFCLEAQLQFQPADSACDSALACFQDGPGATSPVQARALLAKGRMLLKLHRDNDAEAYVREGLAQGERLWATGDPELAVARSELGWCLVRLGRFNDAEPLLLKTYSEQSRAPGTDAKQLRATADHLAELYAAWNKPDLFGHYQLLGTQPGWAGSGD